MGGWRALGFALVLVASCGEEEAGSPAPISPVATLVELPKLKVVGSQFRDPSGRVVFLRGVNFSHRTKSKPYAAWQKPEHFEQIRDWGHNCIRYLLMWDAIEPEPGQFDEAYLDAVEQHLQWAAANGIYVLLDMHQDVYGPAFGGDGAPPWASVDNLVSPNLALKPWFLNYFTPEVIASFDKLWTDAELQSHFVLAWREVAKRAKNHSNVVGYDLFNEPFPGSRWPWTFESGELSSLYAKVAAGILEEHADAIVFLEPSAFPTNQGIPTSLKPLAGSPWVYAPHFYDPLLLTTGSYFGKAYTDWALGIMKAQAASFAVPLFLGEFGVPRTAPQALEAMRDQCDTLDATLAAGWTYWDYNPDLNTNNLIEVDDQSLLDGDQEHPALSALIRPYPRAVAGDPISLSFDLAKGVFRLLVKNPLPGQETVVYLPPLHFPSFTVEFPGEWAFDPDTSALHLSVPSGLTEANLLVRRVP